MIVEHTTKQLALRALVLSWDDVKKIYRRLTGAVQSEADRAIARLVKQEGHTQEQFEAWKQDIKERAFRITVTVNGPNGEGLYGENGDIFDSPLLPNTIKSVYMTNVTAFQSSTGKSPLNSVTLLIDFSRPPLLDADNPLSGPTPNTSHLRAEGAILRRHQQNIALQSICTVHCICLPGDTFSLDLQNTVRLHKASFSIGRTKRATINDSSTPSILGRDCNGNYSVFYYRGVLVRLAPLNQDRR
jgi:hypothetical protein